MYLVLFYDISLSSEGPERTKDSRVLRQVFKICKQYLTHIQNSVFEGELSESQLFKLKTELSNYNKQQSSNSTKQVTCPKCGSTQIQLVPRKWNLITGIFTNQVDRMCLNCKHKF